MKSIIITIGREYGSGGKYIGELVSKKLNIPFYDKNLITKTYEKNNCDYSKLEEYDEVSNTGILKSLEICSPFLWIYLTSYASMLLIYSSLTS